MPSQIEREVLSPADLERRLKLLQLPTTSISADAHHASAIASGALEMPWWQ